MSLVFLPISNLINGLRLHQFLGIRTSDANKSLETRVSKGWDVLRDVPGQTDKLETDANGAH